MLTSEKLMRNARDANKIIPSFNISYLPMVEPIVAALRDANSFGQIAISQVDWEQFEAGSLRRAHEEYQKFKDERYVRLHLDHVPVVDDQGKANDYVAIIGEAIEVGYDSVMVDGSYLPLHENIAATRKIVEMADAAGVPVEGEVGAVLGYQGVPMPYEQLFASRRGFTDIGEAKTFVAETCVHWLSVAVGNIHGALTDTQRNLKKTTAKLDVEHLQNIYDAVDLPLVLHGGSGISKKYIMDAVRHGIAKINVATAVRQPFEAGRKQSVAAAKNAVYKAAYGVLTEELDMADSADVINPTN